MMFIPVERAAKSLGVSARRVRALLAQGRIRGYKSDFGSQVRWMVSWPLDVLPGKRGPDLKHFPVRHVYAPAKPSKRVRKGVESPSSEKIVSRGRGNGSA